MHKHGGLIIFEQSNFEYQISKKNLGGGKSEIRR